MHALFEGSGSRSRSTWSRDPQRPLSRIAPGFPSRRRRETFIPLPRRTEQSPPSGRGDQATWSTVDSGLYAGSRRGEFVGFIESLPRGRYAAFDATSRRVGEFEDATEARSAVEAESSSIGSAPRRGDRGSAGMAAATATGVLAIVLAVLATTSAPLL